MAMRQGRRRRKKGSAPRRGLAVLLSCGLALAAGPRTAAAQDASELEQSVDSAQLIRSREIVAEPVDAAVRATLSRFGSFVPDDTYGEVWVPAATPPGWHPYPPCHWVKARQLGFFYDDPSEWGRIVHHFGRWLHDAQKGWVWIAGNEYSPGWVVWKSDPSWTGWAPMPPQPVGDAAAADAMGGADSWLFQETPRLMAGCQAAQVAPAAQAPTLIADTPYVRSYGIGRGIAVFGVPRWIEGPFIVVEATFRPWPNWFTVGIVSEWNWLWHHTTTSLVKNVCLRKIKGI